MLNQCQFIGHLGADPEIKRTSDGRPIANLRLAVTEKWKSKDTGERQERTEWIRITIFSEPLCKVAEQWLKKGAKIYVSGKWQTRSWEQDGVKKYSTELVMQGIDSKLIMLDSRTDSQPNTGGNEYGDQSSGTRSHQGGGDIEDDPIPFLAEWRV